MSGGFDERPAGAGNRGFADRAVDVEDPAAPVVSGRPPQEGSTDLWVEDSDRDADLVPHERRAEFESRWREIQSQFVDEPREAVTRADALVSEVVQAVMAGFAERTAALERRPDGGADVDTEELRQALRSYRALFDRVLRI